jgi:hypothetical protein
VIQLGEYRLEMERRGAVCRLCHGAGVVFAELSWPVHTTQRCRRRGYSLLLQLVTTRRERHHRLPAMARLVPLVPLSPQRSNNHVT